MYQQPVEDLEDLLIEGPQPNNDISNEWVKKNSDLQLIEQGIPIQNFRELIKKRKLDMEFRFLRRLTESQYHNQALKDYNPSVNKLNRYSNILPYKHTEINLPKSGCYTDDDPFADTYINANYVTTSIRTDAKTFIATQGPLECTRSHFWRMVYSENASMIMMLCRLKEEQRSQCDQYWPEEIGQPVQFGTMKVTMVSSNEIAPQLIERVLTVEDSEKGSDAETRTVTQYQWTGWPDHGVPKQSAYGVVEQQLDLMMKEHEIKPTQPIVVHCSAGVGRTGTLIALFNLKLTLDKLVKGFLKEADDTKKPMYRLSIFGVVRRLREQRWGMVHTPEQYSFLYEVVADMIDKALGENKTSTE